MGGSPWGLKVSDTTYQLNSSNNKLQGVYDEFQVPLDVKSSAILDLVGFNQFLSASPFYCKEVKPLNPKGNRP